MLKIRTWNSHIHYSRCINFFFVSPPPLPPFSCKINQFYSVYLALHKKICFSKFQFNSVLFQNGFRNIHNRIGVVMHVFSSLTFCKSNDYTTSSLKNGLRIKSRCVNISKAIIFSNPPTLKLWFKNFRKLAHQCGMFRRGCYIILKANKKFCVLKK